MNFFDDGSPYLSHPLLTPDRTSAEIDRIGELIDGLADHSLVVDLGCGFGRHCLELASRGHHAVGIDPSAAMIAAAEASRAALSSSLEGTARFIVGSADTTELGLEPASADLAVCLFTTFGQRSQSLPPSASTTDLLQAAARFVKPGGWLVVEVPDRQRTIDGLVTSEQLGPTAVSRRFDDDTGVLHERFENPTSTFDLAYELFSANELKDLLETAGFAPTQVVPAALVPPPPTFMTVVGRRQS